MKYRFAVLVGRFQPFHIAHRNILDRALSQAETVIVALGSHRVAPTIRNPWSSEQRQRMIRACFDDATQARLRFAPVRDYVYNENLWSAELQSRVREIAGDEKDIAIFGHVKDADSAYLRSFPQWHFEEIREREPIRALAIRDAYFRGETTWRSKVPPAIAAFMDDFASGQDFADLVAEKRWVDEYRRDWAAAPYPPTFVTADAVVHKSGHILVVRRRGFPGKGLIALPGGYVEQDETLERAMLRELREETRIAISIPELRKYIRDSAAFDHPDRSVRGRTITHGFYLNLGNTGELPAVKGGDDASNSWWMPLTDVYVNEDKFFEDHVSIITHFVNRS